MTIERWELEQRQRGNTAGAEMARILREQFGEVPLPSVATPVEKQTVVLVETKPIPQEFRPFTEQETKALVKDGAHIFSLTGETIEGQRTAGRLFRYVADGGDGLLKLPSINAQVAIYTDPKKFFIPNSGNKDLPTQEKLAEKDGQELRKRLGLKDEDVDVIIPDQASTLTELIFKYLDETTQKGKGVWLFGSDYDYQCGRTKNAVRESGSIVAGVGDAYPDDGVEVDDWGAGYGYGLVHVVRLVVAKKK